MHIGKSLRVVLSVIVSFFSFESHAFGVDVCFKDKAKHKNNIRNCINVKNRCRTEHLSKTKAITCRLAAVFDSIKGLTGVNGIIGGRSLLHSDSTYFLAQLIGFTPWQAYQIMIYSEATDQTKYTPFNQYGELILTKNELDDCRLHWGVNMPKRCLLTTPMVKGIGKFSPNTGGSLLHLYARYSVDGNQPDDISYPINYTVQDEQLRHFKAWVYDKRADLCAAGITQQMDKIDSPCEQSIYKLFSPANVAIFGFYKMTFKLITDLGPFIIQKDNDKHVVYANNQSFQRYITPHDVALAKVGIFVHSLADRYSHHMCVDRSYFYREKNGNYTSHFSSEYCAQGNHFLWHVWEQGTKQSNQNLEPAFQTLRPALDDVYDQLLAYAKHKGIKINTTLNKPQIINELIAVLQHDNAQQRLDQMIRLMELYKLLPLPGHGTMTNKSIEQWLALAGA